MQYNKVKKIINYSKCFYIGLFDNTNYVKFLINWLSFTKETNTTRYKQVFFQLVVIPKNWVFFNKSLLAKTKIV